MTFLDNKYTRWYYKIIEHRRCNPFDGYKECHHIIPKCMNGSNSKDNLVDLSAREHFICHLLLTKMISKNSQDRFKMIKALSMMMCESETRNKRYVPSSRIYQYIREQVSEAWKGRVFSSEHRQKLSISGMGRVPWNKGKTPSDEYRQRMSDSHKGKKAAPETRKKMSDIHKGRKHTPEAKMKMSIAAKNRTPEHKEKLSIKAKNRTPEHKEKLSVSKKGKNNPMYGVIPWNKGKRKTQDNSLEDFFS
jgi:hypothetical protein